MTCPNQFKLGQRLRKSSIADAPAKEGPHSVGVWTLKIKLVWNLEVYFARITSTCVYPPTLYQPKQYST